LLKSHSAYLGYTGKRKAINIRRVGGVLDWEFPMNNLGRNYVLIGLVWLVVGMAFGIWMGINGYMNYANSHAHANLVGFVVSVLFGLLHINFPAIGKSRVAVPQFFVYEIGALILVLGKAQVDGGGADVLVKIGALVVIIGAALMLYMFARKTA
jgi:hypothetical protein